MTSSQHGLYIRGYTHATMGGTTGGEGATWSESQQACMKPELLVNAGQPYCVEYVPGPCTHRPSRHGSWQHLKSVPQPQGESCLGWG